MSRAFRLLIFWVSVCALAIAAVGAPVAAGATPGPAQASPDEGQAWILVDADTGVVLDGKNFHQPLPPDSAGQLMTALTVAQRMPVEPLDATKTNPVLVSPQATAVPRPKVGISSGGAWPVTPLLNALLMSSANDAAYALAEAASGSIQGFVGEMNTQAKRMEMRDSTWTDPLGDDDSATTPNTASAWDLAVLARSVLSDPQLSDTTRAHTRVVNGPGLGRTINNENDFIDRYQGAVGLKQGQSAKAGGGVLVGAATRDNRTMIVVVMGSPNPIAFGSAELDQGFFSKPDAQGKGAKENLPPVRSSSAQGRLEALVNLPPALGRPALVPGISGAQANPTPAPAPTTTPRARPKDKGGNGGGSSIFTFTNVLLFFLVVVLAVVVVLRRRTVMAQRARRVTSRRTIADARRRGTIDVIEHEQDVGSSHVRVLDPKDRRGRGSRTR